MIFYNKTKEEVLNELNTDENAGLSSKEAIDRQKTYGKNVLAQKKKKSNLMRFLDQFKDVMILILLAAAIISFIIAIIEKQPKDFVEPLLIMAIVIMNALMGVFQENKAEKALDALKKMSTPHAKVYRDHKEVLIDASEVVPGDIIILEAGDYVPADARLLRDSSLKCEESALTGESVPSEKNSDIVIDENAPLGDRLNMVYSGCYVSYGTGKAVVFATGMNTEMGKIANMLANEEEGMTPLQKKLASLGKYLGIMALLACAIVFVVGVASGIGALEIFMTAVSLAVSAIPEGLPAIVTIVLAIGVERMAKRNAIIKRLPAVETLGSASVICSDKTGTLTMNQMTLAKAYRDGYEDLEDIGSANSEPIRQLLLFGALCCNGSVSIDENGQEVEIGDPTETAILQAAKNNGFDLHELNHKYPRLHELPFDSDRKLMTTVNKIDNRKLAIVKGAFDEMEKLCIKGNLAKGREANDAMSKKALRVLAIAYKEIDDITDELESNLVFLGLVGMIDPPRKEAGDAVARCKEAGIRPVMITGDHIMTASAIARELGILNEGERAMTGKELDALNDQELAKVVEEVSVYARVSPENKIRIVKAWQKKGMVVAMTGDGVNDAPALKAADIGCAMGITGTDVAKEAADMTLTDDNFATIVAAVEEGRGIYANIKKVVGFLLGTNIGEIITVFVAMIIWHKSPLLSMQLLLINLVTDSLPAIALGMEKVESDVMKKAPKPKNESIFANGYGWQIALQGIMFGCLSLLAFYLGMKMASSLQAGQTMAFLVLSLSQIVQAYNMRSQHSLLKIGIFTNGKLNMAALISVGIVMAALFSPIGRLFGLVILDIRMYLIALALVLDPFAVMELSKFIGLVRHHS